MTGRADAGWAVGGGCGGDPDHVVQAALVQPEPERDAVAVTGVRQDQWDVHTPRAGLVDRVEGELPLLDVAQVGRDAAAFPARDLDRVGLIRDRVPGLGQEQTPVDRRGRVVAGQVRRHPDLAVGDLARGAGVLPRHACGGDPVLEEPGVVHDQHGRVDRLVHPPRQPRPHMSPVPRAGGHEVGQGLTVAVLAQPGGHRLHRLAPPVQQQPSHIRLSPAVLIRACERLEHLRRERHQILPDLIQLPRCHTPSTHRTPSGHATCAYI